MAVTSIKPFVGADSSLECSVQVGSLCPLNTSKYYLLVWWDKQVTCVADINLPPNPLPVATALT